MKGRTLNSGYASRIRENLKPLAKAAGKQKMYANN